MAKKLRPKYHVYKLDEQGKTGSVYMLSTDPDNIDSPFVLMPRKDPAAFYALMQYSRMCEKDLAEEIRAWAKRIAEAPQVLGTQGARNYTRMKLRIVDMHS